MVIDLPLVWAAIIAFGLMMYVVMDGFDLGVGLLFPFVASRSERDRMVNTVAPVWDGNETWLVLGGAALFAAFPSAYAIILSALYFPVMFMLGGLILRGVSFEFRFKAADSRKLIWDCAFCGGSFLATFSQGVILGKFISGFELDGDVFVGGASSWLTPFSLFTGLAMLPVYLMLGASWLVMKTSGDLQRLMVRLTRRSSLLLLAAIIVVSLWTPFIHPGVMERWFAFPNIVLLAPVPALVVVVVTLQRYALGKDEPGVIPFLLGLVLVFLGYCGLAISLWPFIIPPSISIWVAAGPQQSMGFALVGTLAIIPIVLAYTSWSYFVFRGKQAYDTGYHE